MGFENPFRRNSAIKPEQKLKPEGASSPEEAALHERISKMSAEELKVERQKLAEREEALRVSEQEVMKQFPAKVPDDIRKAWLEEKMKIIRIEKSISRREQQLLDEGKKDREKSLLEKIRGK